MLKKGCSFVLFDNEQWQIVADSRREIPGEGCILLQSGQRPTVDYLFLVLLGVMTEASCQVQGVRGHSVGKCWLVILYRQGVIFRL